MSVYDPWPRQYATARRVQCSDMPDHSLWMHPGGEYVAAFTEFDADESWPSAIYKRTAASWFLYWVRGRGVVA